MLGLLVRHEYRLLLNPEYAELRKQLLGVSLGFGIHEVKYISRNDIAGPSLELQQLLHLWLLCVEMLYKEVVHYRCLFLGCHPEMRHQLARRAFGLSWKSREVLVLYKGKH